MELNQILQKEDTVVIDVRSKLEYMLGHAKGSMNIPLGSLSGHVDELKQRKGAIVLCCASGARSEQAMNMLKRAGCNVVHNAGPWTNTKI